MKGLLGGILLAAGILIAGASGLCSVAVLVTSVVETFSYNEPGMLLSMLLAVLIVGGIPFAIGTALFVTGRRMLRSAREDQRSAGPQPE